MTYIFFGTPRFAAIVLERLIAAGLPPVAVVTNPDRPVGRKKVVTSPPVKTLAVERAIPVLQPETLKGFEDELRKLNADLFLVAAYAKIIPREILGIPGRGTLGIHPSLLPRYRGASPIQTAILKGDAVTGVTLYLLDEAIDHGPIVAQETLGNVDMGVATYADLEEKLATLGGAMAVRVLPAAVAGALALQPQDEGAATPTKKFRAEDGFVEWDYLTAAMSGTAEEMASIIHRRIRALNPEPGVWTLDGERRMKLLEAALEGGRLKLTRIQYAGEKPKNLQ
ncbi:MAG: methionyl-tRNA formyltransferase [Patescibacteria group bacterium]